MNEYRLTVTLTKRTRAGRETIAQHQWNGERASVNTNGVKLVVGGECIALEFNGVQMPAYPPSPKQD